MSWRRWILASRAPLLLSRAATFRRKSERGQTRPSGRVFGRARRRVSGRPSPFSWQRHFATVAAREIEHGGEEAFGRGAADPGRDVGGLGAKPNRRQFRHAL